MSRGVSDVPGFICKPSTRDVHKGSMMTALERLRELKDKSKKLEYHDLEGLDEVKRRGEMLLSNLFGSDSTHVADLRSIWLVASAPRTHDAQVEEWSRGRNNLVSLFSTVEEQLDLFGHPALKTDGAFVDPQRLIELRGISSAAFDLSRLIQLCEELNRCASSGCYTAIAALSRAVLDHVPPIFGFNSFNEVANNHSGTKSFQESMKHLNESARKVGDAHLHTQIRRRETLPTATQVNFSSDIDVLLGEVIRILSSP